MQQTISVNWGKDQETGKELILRVQVKSSNHTQVHNKSGLLVTQLFIHRSYPSQQGWVVSEAHTGMLVWIDDLKKDAIAKMHALIKQYQETGKPDFEQVIKERLAEQCKARIIAEGKV